MKTRITSFESYGNGWLWSTQTVSGTERHYRTSGNGEGLFQTYPNGDEHQIWGFTQYALPGDRKQARAKVYRDFVVRSERP